MREKLTIEQFRQIREQMNHVVSQLASQETDDTNKENDFINKYLELQNKILSYDLSDIPFEEWNNFIILSDNEHFADFSQTKANIDFDLVSFDAGFGNFKGCNLRNVEEAHRKIFTLFDNDFIKKFYNYSLTIDDLTNLSKEQFEELNMSDHYDYRDLYSHLENSFVYAPLFNNLEFEKAMELYKYSKEDFSDVAKIISLIESRRDAIFQDDRIETFMKEINNLEVQNLKQYSFDYCKTAIKNGRYHINLKEYPKSFIEENKDILLIDADIPEEVRERYYTEQLTIQDLIDYKEVFNNISVDNFMDHHTFINKFIKDHYGVGEFQKLVEKYPIVFEHLYQVNNLYSFTDSFTFTKKENLELDFLEAVKKYFMKIEYRHDFNVENENGVTYNVPEWLKSLNFTIIDKIDNVDKLLNYNPSVFILDSSSRDIINILGIDNIKRFEQETGFFSHKNEGDYALSSFEYLCSYYEDLLYKPQSQIQDNIISQFKNGTLPYEEFKDKFADLLENVRKGKTGFNYDFIQGDFRNKHKEIFIDDNVPENLKNAFYSNNITLKFIKEHPEYIRYLIDRDLSHIIDLNESDFISEYSSRYGNEDLIKLLVKYEDFITDISIPNFLYNIDNKEELEKEIRRAIYKIIITKQKNYKSLIGLKEMEEEYPEIFLNLDSLTSIPKSEKERITDKFYQLSFNFDDIRKYPELIKVLKDKNLPLIFNYSMPSQHFKEYDKLINAIGTTKFLQLCSLYGDYIKAGLISSFEGINQDTSVESISRIIEENIVKQIKAGDSSVSLEDAPELFKNNYPEFFLSEDAPRELKLYYYNHGYNYPLTFELLSSHKEWLPFLEGKNITCSLLKNYFHRREFIRYIQLFGEEKAIKLGISRGETVTKMIEAGRVQTMKEWYDKTGGKFIPDYVIMQNFDISQIDQFLLSSSNWSNLMRIKSYASKIEFRDAMLKLAYSFGAFDQDQRGYKKAIDLLTGLPKSIPFDREHNLQQVDRQIDLYSQRGYFYKNSAVIDENGNVTLEYPDMTKEEKEEAYNKMIDQVKKVQFDDYINTDNLLNLLEALKQEEVDIDFSKPLFAQIYRKREDESFVLTVNAQNYPKTAMAIREILGKYHNIPMLTPEKAHQLFGAFKLQYDPDFREFLLANMDKIMENPECVSLISSIQRQFKDIKTYNSNRALTLDLAISYVQKNRYDNVEQGNEKAAEISAIAGYSQADFDVLQQIYNYGKQRTFSSIPRVEGKNEKYTYEILRLDDPLAMAIGTLTDCCQELNDHAEVCMEHSMVDKNGRVFVIKDNEGNIVAQSWVWRNKDVLCFDNIEIPNKAFTRAEREAPKGREQLTEEVFSVYKQAAKELMEEDKKVYKELLEQGKITEEQYEGLRLGKVTVGAGYNDIAAALKKNAPVDKGAVAKPLLFEQPVPLSGRFYTDSATQYILEERKDRKEYTGDTLSVHNDTYIVHDDSNFKLKDLLSLEKLEIITKEAPSNLETFIEYHSDSKNLVTELASNYDLNPNTTRIVMNPNFAIIFDINNGRIKIGDLLFNTKIENEHQKIDMEQHVLMQIRLAIEQISQGKKIDISELNDKQKEMYNKALGLKEELDIERGVKNAK